MRSCTSADAGGGPTSRPYSEPSSYGDWESCDSSWSDGAQGSFAAALWSEAAAEAWEAVSLESVEDDGVTTPAAVLSREGWG